MVLPVDARPVVPAVDARPVVPAQPTVAGSARTRLRIEGTVQGVGFRPFVYRLARALDLGGFVRNDCSGVLIEVEGPSGALEDFSARVRAEAPPLASIERVIEEPLTPAGQGTFQIAPSTAEGAADTPVTPDSATCEECLRELLDPADRRFRYPFTNCTNCGPRFTIVRGVPYDRPLTTMASFPMCSECRREYEDPLDRRFHAQPNACPACGPHVWLADGAGRSLAERDEALSAVVAALLDGSIVAVKGIGGFHLACLAEREAAVSRLRSRKHREDRPFALMAPDVEAALRLVSLTSEERRLLLSPQRPIVIARRRAEGGGAVARSVAPRCRELGVMLPYSPLHHLLLADLGRTLVMTSGNLSDEPIAFTDSDALERLGPVADSFLLHDRPIETRTDDSVVRSVGSARRPVLLRRSRGYVPAPLRLPVPARRMVLACGGELKNTFCMAKGERAWVSHHIGDLENYETLRSFTTGIEHFERLFAVAPSVVAHDLHPEYLSTKYALERSGVEVVGVQHHHAHLAACLAEHGEPGPAVGAIFDGTGYGTDGTVWGGELLVGDLAGFERAGHLWPVRLPGGAAAVREPWRMACSWRVAVFGEAPAAPPGVDPAMWRGVARLASGGGPASPVTTSMGRLFDAVAALCGLRLRVSYEGQAASELEACCDAGESGAYPLALSGTVLDARETVRALIADLEAGVEVPVVAARFHRGVAEATAQACIELGRRHGLDTVVLSGGSFQNRLLLQWTAERLTAAGLRVLVPSRLPPGDGGISYGQAAVAAARMAP